MSSKYTPDDRLVDDKHRLYELYWGEMLSIQQIADRTTVGRETVRRKLEAHGIPRRTNMNETPDSIFDYFTHLLPDTPSQQPNTSSSNDGSSVDWAMASD